METSTVRALRGATTVETDTPEEISSRTLEVLHALLEQNSLEHQDIISIFFTATPDLVSAFPATGPRLNGFGDVPLMCAQEIAVNGSAQRCVRILLHVNTDKARSELHHVYLHGAQGLRDDLPK